MSAARTVRQGLPLQGISTQFIRELRHTVIYEDEDEQEVAVLVPYERWLEMESLIVRADALLPDAPDPDEEVTLG